MQQLAHPVDAILNVEQAAAFLEVSPSQVRHACKLVDGHPDRIPNFRMGKHIRIPFWGLLEWIARRSGAGMPSAPSGEHRPARMLRSTRSRRLIRKR